MSSGASSFNASLLQAVDGVMSLALCPQVCPKLLRTSDLPRSKPLVNVALPACLSARSSPFTRISFINQCCGTVTWIIAATWVVYWGQSRASVNGSFSGTIFGMSSGDQLCGSCSYVDQLGESRNYGSLEASAQ